MPRIKVKARAVDMLGRQQIAGIPTAIHELFKNAHDAYAERVEVDYFRRNKVLVLRDDGYGMTRDDVEDRWLTLGTESRVGANRPQSIADWTGPKNLPRRSIMGEKGIGRLAIAAIAPITLLFSRAVRPKKKCDLVVALVHWGLFEQPGLDISQIVIPVTEYPGGTLPESKDIKDLVREVQDNIENLKDDLEDKDVVKNLLSELKKVQSIDPNILDSTLREHLKKDEPPLSLKDDGYGTHFIMFPTVPELTDDIDGGADREASLLERNLLGFSNTMGGGTPLIRAEFRDHHLDDFPEELIGPGNFWLKDEYDMADHRFKGEFDENGQFVGNVEIFEESKPFVCNWVEGRGRPTKCGPFKIDFAYVQGLQRDSSLGPDDWKKMMIKLDRIGGLYIYRDSIRVMPYGNSDVDWLNIEKRRTYSAQDWFFSYRRLFGSITINHDKNSSLHEKAGREGFRQNQAYREFRAILVNFFQRLAFEFFRPDSPQGERYWEKKDEHLAADKLLKKQKSKADERRKEFDEHMQKFFKNYETGFFGQRANKILLRAGKKLRRLSTLEDDGDLAVGIRELEADLFNRTSNLSSLASIVKPRGLALTKRLEKDWAAYRKMSEEVQSSVIHPLKTEISTLIDDITSNRISESQRRDATMELLETQKDNLVKELSALRRDAYAASEEMQSTLKTVVREEFSQFSQAVESMLLEFAHKSAKNPAELDKAKEHFEQEVRAIREKESSLLESIRRQMEDFAEALTERETSEDRTGALEQKVQRLEEQLEFYSDFAQMGMSVGILQHEFEKTARNMRTAMRDIKPWADGTPELKKVFRRLRQSFDHLEGYLKLLDPLGRRMRRTKISISGDEIRMYILRTYKQALEENDITLEASDVFLKKTVTCRTSALLGAFINVVDNAVYWTSNTASEEKTIFLDANEEGFLLSNTGQGIEERLRERIFEFGETQKPGGRGMGLSISREVLAREEFGLELIQAGLDTEPVFLIRTAIEEGGNDE